MATDEDVPERERRQTWVIYLPGMQAGAREEIKTSMECRSPVRHIAQRDNKGTQITPKCSVLKYPTSTSAAHKAGNSPTPFTEGYVVLLIYIPVLTTTSSPSM